MRNVVSLRRSPSNLKPSSTLHVTPADCTYLARLSSLEATTTLPHHTYAPTAAINVTSRRDPARYLHFHPSPRATRSPRHPLPHTAPATTFSLNPPTHTHSPPASPSTLVVTSPKPLSTHLKPRLARLAPCRRHVDITTASSPHTHNPFTTLSRTDTLHTTRLHPSRKYHPTPPESRHSAPRTVPISAAAHCHGLVIPTSTLLDLAQGTEGGASRSA
ncbi:hypothetical protein R3P38DRAFT_3267849 [Favolaschia claudopus]|uniref:Uncharacterized protein n=1 Tax=Favolaschia claudopus TaxID=2862362 RepID=A0AAW0BQE2_9AGAR